MSRDHVRGFFGRLWVNSYRDWSVGVDIRQTFLFVAYHLCWVGIGYIIHGIVDLWP